MDKNKLIEKQRETIKELTQEIENLKLEIKTVEDERDSAIVDRDNLMKQFENIKNKQDEIYARYQKGIEQMTKMTALNKQIIQNARESKQVYEDKMNILLKRLKKQVS